MRKNLSVFVLTILLAGGPVLAYLYYTGSGEEHVRQMLRLTAWTAVLVYLIIFVARPLKQLNGSQASRELLKNRRYFGVALAAVMTVHLVLLIIVNDRPLNVPGAIIFALLYLMLFTSFDSSPARLGPRNWRLLHKTGLYGLGIGYLSAVGGSFLKSPLDPVYLTLMILMLAAIAVRVSAYLKSRTGILNRG
jgi:DMSO/TMAO reductase YedYZ heme-binding membrane subunit